MLTTLEIFLWGLGGSVAVEVVALAQYLEDGRSASRLPERYRRFEYYVIRILLAVVAGGLAVAYQIDKPLLAANIGAATPLIVQALSQGLPASSPGAPLNKRQASRATQPANTQ